jgi:shikimate kinase / 3-dehydroquinate synthase
MVPLFLVGFMATGKTTVGRQVAAAHGRRFVDLDDVIAAREAAPAADLVARDEPSFRAAEAAALAAVVRDAAADPAVVVATGGGAAAHGDNLDRMRDAGLVVALTAGLDTSRARAAGGPARPLLDAAAADLLRRREPAYRRAHAAVATDHDDPHGVAARITPLLAAADRLGARRRDATLVALGDRSYPVVVEDGALDGGLVAGHLPAGVTRVAVIADDDVARLWAEPTVAALRGAGLDPVVVTFPAGEASKTLATHGALCARLIEHRLDRRSAIVALGGGVTGDLAGFVAATLFRGVPCVQLPTTLVAMVDSAIGGKTGVDLAAGKNLVGAFWQPRAVIACLPWLDTLPVRERRAAFGELWKYGVLDGPPTWDAVAGLAGWARGAAPAERGAVTAVIRRAAAYKAWIVSRDERETLGERALLNLGHTVGHAIEAAAGWSRLHGECVALGLIAAARASSALVGAPADLERRIATAIADVGLDADVDPWLTDAVLARIAVDKKRAGDRVGFVAVRDLGRCDVVEVELDELRRILRRREPL